MIEFWLIIFVLSANMLLHSYLIYPFVIWLVAKLAAKQFSVSSEYRPEVSIIISAYNEEKVIKETITTLLRSNYPVEKMEIIAGSDCSDDRTNEILRELDNSYPNVHSKIFSERRGKALVLNDLIKEAAGDLLVFCDANTLYDPDALNNLVHHFYDESVGGVSGKLTLKPVDDVKTSASQETKYWDYETVIKKSEGKMGCLIGANGGIYAIRKEYFVELPSDKYVCDDFYVSMKVLQQKKSFLYEENATATETAAPTVKSEFRRKTRIQAKNLSALGIFSNLLFSNDFLLSFNFWSHKVLRWFTPLFILAMIISAGFLISYSIIFLYFLYGTAAAVGLIFLSYIFSLLKIRFTPLLVGYYFLVMNLSLLVGMYYYISRKDFSSHQPPPRS